MMELEKFSFYRGGHNQFPGKRDRGLTMDPSLQITCVAEDLSLPSKKTRKSENPTRHPGSSSRGLENSKLPEGTYVKTEVMTQIMDIQQPVAGLRNVLELQLGIDLSNCQIWLQDKMKLSPEMSLGEQCIQSEGMAQVKLELNHVAGKNRINILDVLRCPEDFEPDEDDNSSTAEDLSVNGGSSIEDNCTETIPSKWMIYEDINSLFPISLPSDPSQWTDIQLYHWLQWGLKEFKIKQVSDALWNITGKQLCQMSQEDFRRLVPSDPQNLFWTHIELLRKCRIFAVVDKINHQASVSPALPEIAVTGLEPTIRVTQKANSRKPRTPSSSSSNSSSNGNFQVSTKRPTMTGHNGQIQLWQFLLELLGDSRRRDVIQWVGNDGEFKLSDPELVAQMWGERKNKPKMNYEKLSRALRYYYHDGMIAKVHGRRFVYKFERKLKDLVGLTTEELLIQSGESGDLSPESERSTEV